MKVLILLIVLVFLTEMLLSQDYTSLVVSNAHWIQGSYNDEEGYFRLHGYSIGGDTTIQGIAYHTLTRYEFEHQFGNYKAPYIINSKNTVGVIREDRSQKKVYAILHKILDKLPCDVLGKELVWYDFNVHIGDPLLNACVYQQVDEDKKVILDKVVSDFKIDSMRNVYYGINPDFGPSEPYFIEGIGSIYGLFYPINTFSFAGFYPFLADHCIGSEADCGIVIKPSSTNDLNERVKIYPNPVQEILSLEFSQNMTLPIKYEIKSIEQKLSLQGTASDLRPLSLDVSNLYSGVHILTISDGNNQVIHKKWVKL